MRSVLTPPAHSPVVSDVDIEIAEAIAQAGHCVRTCREITTIRFPTINRRVYRVDLESGETIKIRRLEDEPTAQRLFESRQDLPDTFVPAFYQHGRVVLERWVDGRILGIMPPTDAQLVETGMLLAGLHARGRRTPEANSEDDMSAWRLRTEGRLQQLVEACALSAKDAARIGHVLQRSEPRRGALGVGHFDFCGENMLVDHSGRLRVFDNDRIGVGSLGYDVGRAWYRWGLSAEAWTIFRTAYTSVLPDDAPFVSLDFWRIVALVQSACLRLHTDPQYLLAPVSALRQLAVADGVWR
jgi:hypothetical protein